MAKRAVAKKVVDTYVPQQEIKIKSDGNLLVFKNTIEQNNDVYFIYEYKKSKTKKGQLLGLLKPELEKLIRTNA